MPVADVFDIDKNKVSQIELNDAVFGAQANHDVVYEVVRMQMASRRQGTAATKERGDIRGGGKKPWRQKGTGRARAGTTRSPLWRGGGTVFGPRPKEHAFKVPRKVRKAAIISALSMKFSEDRIVILKEFPMEEIKTRKFKEVVERFGFRKALFILDKPNQVLEKSSKNLSDIKMIKSEGINVYDLLKHDHVVLLEPSVRMIEGALLA
jgi:large subunit ribosomal protein L4